MFRYDLDQEGRMPAHQHASALSPIHLRRTDGMQSVSYYTGQLRSRSLSADALFIALLEADLRDLD